MQRLHALDERLYDLVAGRGHGPAEDVLAPLSSAADYSRLWMGIALLLALVGGSRGRRIAVTALATVATTSALANLVLKLGVGRRRPERDTAVPGHRHVKMPTSTSFPSGHSASAAAFATVIALEAPRYVSIPVVALAAAVGYSRVYTGVHYPGDVAAGALVGTCTGVVGHMIATRVHPAA